MSAYATAPDLVLGPPTPTNNTANGYTMTMMLGKGVFRIQCHTNPMSIPGIDGNYRVITLFSLW